jgi:hypothetical protein
LTIHPAITNALKNDPTCRVLREARGIQMGCPLGRNIEIRNFMAYVDAAGRSGWSPERIYIRRKFQRFNPDKRLVDILYVQQLKKIAKKRNIPLDKDNGKKLMLRAVYPDDLIDIYATLTLELADTDYYSIAGVLSSIRKSQELRHSAISIDPSQHEVPHAFCLHFIVRLQGGDFLLLHRSETVQHEPGKVSFSFEEQIHPEKDFSRLWSENTVMRIWILRSLMEEVYKDRDTVFGSPRAETIEREIDWYKIVSLFLEEPVGGFALCAFVQLNITLGQYREKFSAIESLRQQDN